MLGMTTPEPTHVPTIAKPASAFLAGGVAVTVLAFAVLLAAGYAGITDPATQFDGGSSVPLAWVGWLGLLGGVALLWVGVLRLVQHADRAAGITYPAATASVAEQ
jgi:hypothetical protein